MEKLGNAFNKLVDCYSSCTDHNCKLVLAGNSAGGSVVSLIPVLLKELHANNVPKHWIHNPLVLTLGSFSGVTNNEECFTHLLSNHFNFIRYEEDSIVYKGTYDLVPYLFNNDRTGYREIVMNDYTDNNNMKIYEGGDNLDVPILDGVERDWNQDICHVNASNG